MQVHLYLGPLDSKKKVRNLLDKILNNLDDVNLLVDTILSIIKTNSLR